MTAGEEPFGPAWVVSWRHGGQAHWIDFDNRDSALSFSLLATECGREQVAVARGPWPEVPEGAKERIWRGIAMRLGEEKVREHMARLAAESDAALYRALVEAPPVEAPG